jgi:hypothetical protein
LGVLVLNVPFKVFENTSVADHILEGVNLMRNVAVEHPILIAGNFGAEALVAFHQSETQHLRKLLKKAALA